MLPDSHYLINNPIYTSIHSFFFWLTERTIERCTVVYVFLCLLAGLCVCVCAHFVWLFFLIENIPKDAIYTNKYYILMQCVRVCECWIFYRYFQWSWSWYMPIECRQQNIQWAQIVRFVLHWEAGSEKSKNKKCSE